jgi:hypothetical protein
MRTLAILAVLACGCPGLTTNGASESMPAPVVAPPPTAPRDVNHLWYCWLSKDGTYCTASREQCLNLMDRVQGGPDIHNCTPQNTAVCFDHYIVVDGRSTFTCFLSIDECVRNQRAFSASNDYRNVSMCYPARAMSSVARFQCLTEGLSGAVFDCYRESAECDSMLAAITRSGLSHVSCTPSADAWCYIFKDGGLVHETCARTREFCEQKLGRATPAPSGCVIQ